MGILQKGGKMNISYVGATENSNYRRFAVIQYAPKEEAKVDRFGLLLSQMFSYTIFGEEDLLYIQVEDREDFEYVKNCFKSYKKSKIFEKESKAYSYEKMYKEAKTDAEMYCFLVQEGRTENEIKKIMRDVSGADDAYNNALYEINCELF